MSNDLAPRQVGIGTHVEVELIDEQGQPETMAFDVVHEKAADFDRGLLGENAPLVKAIRGKFVGSVVAYRMGDICKVRIVSVAPSHAEAPADAEARRQAVLQKALDDVERTNAEIFAASYSGKWGDYNLDDNSQADES
jgi:hypothetical protein